MHSKKLLCTAAAALLLAGCAKEEPTGPDVAYAGPTTSASIGSAASVGAVATAVVGATKSFSGFAGGAAVVSGASASERATVQRALRLVAEARRANAAVPSGVVASFTLPCEAGGSMTLSAQDQDGANTTTHAGDYVELAFDECTDGFGTVSWGSLRLLITVTAGNDFLGDPNLMQDDFAYGLEMTFRDFATVDASGAWSGADGDVELTWTADHTFQVVTFAMTGTSLVGAEGQGDTILHAFMLAEATPGAGYADTFEEWYDDGFDLPPTAATWDFDGRVCALAIGGCLNVATEPPFSQFPFDLFPNEGTMTITADSGAYIQLAVVALNAGTTGAVNVTYSLDGVIAFGPFPTTWTCLDAPNSSACLAD